MENSFFKLKKSEKIIKNHKKFGKKNVKIKTEKTEIFRRKNCKKKFGKNLEKNFFEEKK